MQNKRKRKIAIFLYIFVLLCFFYFKNHKILYFYVKKKIFFYSYKMLYNFNLNPNYFKYIIHFFKIKISHINKFFFKTKKIYFSNFIC